MMPEKLSNGSIKFAKSGESYMRYEYRINEKERLIYQSFKGACCIGDLEIAILELTQDPNFNPDYDVLTDLRTCEFTFLPENLTSVVQMFKERFGENTGTSALLVDTPIETVIAGEYQSMIGNGREIHVFCTYEGALDWLKRGVLPFDREWSFKM